MVKQIIEVKMTFYEAMKIEKRSDGCYHTDCKKFKTFTGAVRYNKKCGFDENGNSLKKKEKKIFRHYDYTFYPVLESMTGLDISLGPYFWHVSKLFTCYGTKEELEKKREEFFMFMDKL
jgi:hypothetical protein